MKFYITETQNSQSQRAGEIIEAKDLTKDFYVGVNVVDTSKIPYYEGVDRNVNKTKIERLKTLDNYFENKNFWWFVGRFIGDGWVEIRKRPKRNNSYSYNTIISCSVIIYFNLF